MKAFEFKPKLYTALKNYSKELFMADLMAGIIVGIVALPLAIASAKFRSAALPVHSSLSFTALFSNMERQD